MEDRRQIQRKQVYLGQGFDLNIHLKKQNASYKGEAQDVSPTGVGAVFTGEPPQALEIGDPIAVEYTSPMAYGLKVHGVVASLAHVVIQEKTYLRVGVLFLGSDKSLVEKGTISRRSSPRYKCPEFLRPMVWAKTPLFYGDDIHFQVVDFGASSMGLLTSLRNKFIQKGMHLDFKVTFPVLGDHMVKGEIVSLTIDHTHKRMRLGVAYRGASRDFCATMSEFVLLLDKSISPKELKDAGFVVKTVDKALTLDYARSAQDYEKILQLRLEANQASGKFGDLTLRDMASPFDMWSRQIVARYGDEIVGAVRVTFTDGKTQRSAFLSQDGYTIPQEILDTKHIETGNMVIKPTFQKTNLFREISRFAVKTCMESGGSYLLAGAEEVLVPIYIGLGFVKIDEKQVEPKPGWRFKGSLLALDLNAFSQENEPHTRSYETFGPVYRHVRLVKGSGQA